MFFYCIWQQVLPMRRRWFLLHLAASSGHFMLPPPFPEPGCSCFFVGLAQARFVRVTFDSYAIHSRAVRFPKRAWARIVLPTFLVPLGRVCFLIEPAQPRFMLPCFLGLLGRTYYPLRPTQARFVLPSSRARVCSFRVWGAGPSVHCTVGCSCRARLQGFVNLSVPGVGCCCTHFTF